MITIRIDTVPPNEAGAMHFKDMVGLEVSVDEHTVEQLVDPRALRDMKGFGQHVPKDVLVDALMRAGKSEVARLWSKTFGTTVLLPAGSYTVIS